MPLPKPILIVDEPGIRALLKVMLAEDYTVITAKDGTSALHELWKRGGDVALLLTDVDMGRMNGVELAQTVRSQFPGVPIMFISGLPMSASELDRVAPGRVLVAKPFERATLLHAVEQAIGFST